MLHMPLQKLSDSTMQIVISQSFTQEFIQTKITKSAG